MTNYDNLLQIHRFSYLWPFLPPEGAQFTSVVSPARLLTMARAKGHEAHLADQTELAPAPVRPGTVYPAKVSNPVCTGKSGKPGDFGRGGC
jgi:hypothetical protein